HFAGVQTFSFCRYVCEYVRVNQVVVDDYFCFSQQVECFYRKKIGSPWSSAYEINLAGSVLRCDCFADAFDRSVDDQTMRGKRLSYLICDVVVAIGGSTNFDGNVTACVPARRKKVGMYDDVLRAVFD